MSKNISREYRQAKPHHMAKLEPSDIPLIRSLLSDGLGCEEIGKKFSVSRQTIYRIKTNQIWKHVK